MSYASFTNFPASAKFPASVGTATAARVARGRLTVLLIAATATEFLLVAVAAYFAAALYHRLILQSWPESAKCIPEALLIATRDSARFHRASAMFPNSNATPAPLFQEGVL